MIAESKPANRKKKTAVNIRMDGETKAMLAELAAAEGLTVSSYQTVLIRREHAKLKRAQQAK